jgi:hypothetical protein
VVLEGVFRRLQKEPRGANQAERICERSWPAPGAFLFNQICLALGADHVGFADLVNYLPSTRSPHCSYEYRTLVRAFEKEITPHIDQEAARQVLDTNWLHALESNPAPPK